MDQNGHLVERDGDIKFSGPVTYILLELNILLFGYLLLLVVHTWNEFRVSSANMTPWAGPIKARGSPLAVWGLLAAKGLTQKPS